MRAVYPGSFDPFTLGHLNILERAIRMFDRIDIVVASNQSKKYMFTPDQRYRIVQLSTEHLGPSISVIPYPDIVADYIMDNKIDVILRGIRGSSDLDYEIKLEQYNRKACFAETIYLTPGTEHLNTSSTLVRMFLHTNKTELASEYVTENAMEYIKSL